MAKSRYFKLLFAILLCPFATAYEIQCFDTDTHSVAIARDCRALLSNTKLAHPYGYIVWSRRAGPPPRELLDEILIAPWSDTLGKCRVSISLVSGAARETIDFQAIWKALRQVIEGCVANENAGTGGYTLVGDEQKALRLTITGTGSRHES